MENRFRSKTVQLVLFYQSIQLHWCFSHVSWGWCPRSIGFWYHRDTSCGCFGMFQPTAWCITSHRLLSTLPIGSIPHPVVWWKNQLKGVCNHPRWMSSSMTLQFFTVSSTHRLPCHWRLRAGSAARIAFIFSTHEVLYLQWMLIFLKTGWHRWHKHVVSFGLLCWHQCWGV